MKNFKSRSVHISSSLRGSINSSQSPLLKEPFIRLKVIEAKDVFLNQGLKREMGDLYARISYEAEISHKTNVVTKSSHPKWNSTCEFPLYINENQEGNVISISIYDADPWGSDELLATQSISLAYFKRHDCFGKQLDFWLKLDHVNASEKDEQILVETDVSLYQDLNLPEFEEELINDPIILNDNKIPKLHLILEIFDLSTIKHFNISIPEVEESRENGLLEGKVFIYVIKVTRNDGLEWYIKRRYSEIRNLRNSLSERNTEIKELPFPGKTVLTFTSKFFSTSEKEYQKICAERKKALEEFLSKIVKIERNYNMKEFNKFFSVHERQF